MPRHTWFDRLLRLSHPDAASTPAPPVEGLVLSGGGARASFQLGALRYLYERARIAPTRILGTSAGSIAATILAQSADPAAQAGYLAELEELWLAMNDASQMFTEQAWFTRLRNQWDDLAALLPQPGEAGAPPGDETTVTETDPARRLEEAMTDDPSQDMAPGPAIWQLLGLLPRLGRAGAGLATTVRGAERAASAYRPGPLVHRLLFESGFKASRVPASGVQLRIAFVDLNSGALRFMRQDGIIVDRDDRPVDATRYELALGVWASCSIPGVFRPVQLGQAVCVDGGIRENVPVELAVNSLGVTKPYVVAASPPGVEAGDFSAKDMVSVLLRTAAITWDETVQDEIGWARAAGACVIEPHIDVHGAMTVEPALLRINRDHGWIRAAEEVTGAPGSLRDIDDAIIAARCDWAKLENPPAGQSPDDKAEQVSGIQARLAELLSQADPALLPPNATTWPTPLA